MSRILSLFSVIFLGAILACGNGEQTGGTNAQATIQAAVSGINSTLAAAGSGGSEPTATPAERYVPSELPTDVPAPAATVESSQTRHDFQTLDNAAYLEQSEPQSAQAIKDLIWVRDGISDDQLESVDLLIQLAAFHEPIFWTLVGSPWLRDGLNDPEAAVVLSVAIIAQRDQSTAERIAGARWLEDDVTDPESEAIKSLALISQSDAEAALRMVNMPFLKSIEPADLPALRSLRQLAYGNPGAFRQVIDHPTFGGGINDDWTPVVATLQGVSRTNPGLIDTLLDPNRVTVESRVVELPRSGEVSLSIIRTQRGAGRSMDLLESSVRNAEQFMSVALPDNHVSLLFELAVAGASAGTNFGPSITIRPKFDVDDGTHEADAAGHIIAHEVAHYYWNSNADWVDEGVSELMASVSELARVGHPLDATNYPCAYAPNISALESLNTVREADAFACNYSFGERIFLDLYHSLGDTPFRQGLRNLYRLSTIEDDADDLAGTPVGITELRSAFSDAASASSVDPIVSRWYEGTTPRDANPVATGGVDPTLPSVEGRVDQAFISVSEDGQPASGFSAEDVQGPVFLNLEYSYPLRSTPQAVHFQVVETFQDGFMFRRRNTTIEAQPGYSGGRQWLQVGPSLTSRWAAGWHLVQVYEGGRKVAEVRYVVTP